MSDNNNGCNSLLTWVLIVIAVVFCIILSAAGFKSWGLEGLLVGPIVIIGGIGILGWIYGDH